MPETMNMENAAFKAYVVCASLLVIKMMLVGVYTMYNRIKSFCFSADEDRTWNTILFYMRKGGPVTRLLAPSQHMKAGDKEKYLQLITRLQCCHQNDMENIMPFLFVAFLYMQCGFQHASVYFYGFTLARFLHTLCYLGLKSQPWRSICYLVGVYCTCTMALQMVMLAGKSQVATSLVQ